MVLVNFLSNNSLGFTSNQTVTLLNLFSFSSDKARVINISSPFILTLKVDGVVSILKTFSFSSDKLATLSLIINLTNTADLQLYNQSIVNLFSFSFDQTEAKKIIANSAPRSCLFGPTNLPRFAFIIDVSGSMSYTFRDIDGVVYTRLQYVQKDIKHVLETTVRPSQQFNIISFSDNARAWKLGVVPATSANIASAEAFTFALAPGGGTYMLNALKLAFSDPLVMGVYFLSDGDPSDSSINILNYLPTVKKPVNTIAFKATPSAAGFMYKMAKTTGGTFRNIA
uniref:VWFA domain-containing protein n=1 Tax=Arcella intermedia TaxID=1963864 RepID=A0A6B2LBX9_9EUKA